MSKRAATVLVTTGAIALAVIFLVISAGTSAPKLGSRPRHPVLRMLTEPLAKAHLYARIEKTTPDKDRADFDRLDIDRSNDIDFSEFLAGMGPGLSHLLAVNEDGASKQFFVFAAMDSDGSGSLTFDEWSPAGMDDQMKADQMARIMADIAMTAHDKDGDRALNHAEFSSFMALSLKIGMESEDGGGDFEQMTSAEIDAYNAEYTMQWLALIDRDQSTTVSLAELQAMFAMH